MFRSIEPIIQPKKHHAKPPVVPGNPAAGNLWKPRRWAPACRRAELSSRAPRPRSPIEAMGSKSSAGFHIMYRPRGTGFPREDLTRAQACYILWYHEYSYNQSKFSAWMPIGSYQR